MLQLELGKTWLPLVSTKKELFEEIERAFGSWALTNCQALVDELQTSPPPAVGKVDTADVCQPQFSVAGWSSYVYRVD